MAWSTSRIRMVAILFATPAGWATASWAWYAAIPSPGVKALILGQGIALATGWPVVTLRAMVAGRAPAPGWRRRWFFASRAALFAGVVGLGGLSCFVGAKLDQWDVVRRGTLTAAPVVQWELRTSESSDPEYGGAVSYHGRLQDPVDGSDLGWVDVSRDEYGRDPLPVYLRRGGSFAVVPASLQDEGPVVLRVLLSGSAGLELIVLTDLATRPRRRRDPEPE